MDFNTLVRTCLVNNALSCQPEKCLAFTISRNAVTSTIQEEGDRGMHQLTNILQQITIKRKVKIHMAAAIKAAVKPVNCTENPAAIKYSGKCVSERERERERERECVA